MRTADERYAVRSRHNALVRDCPTNVFVICRVLLESCDEASQRRRTRQGFNVLIGRARYGASLTAYPFYPLRAWGGERREQAWREYFDLVLAQRAAAKGPRWTRVIEGRLDRPQSVQMIPPMLERMSRM